MWHLFSKEIESKESSPPIESPAARPGPIATWLVGGLKWVESRLTSAQKRIVFLCYVAAFSLGCVLAVTSPFRSSSDQAVSLDFGDIKGAASAYTPQEGSGFAPDSLQQQIINYQHFLDSMKNDPQGKTYYDSLVKAQPGFLDTLENVVSFLKSLKN